PRGLIGEGFGGRKREKKRLHGSGSSLWKGRSPWPLARKGKRTSRSLLLFLLVVGVLVSITRVVAGGDNVGAAEPAVEIDIGAALGAEGLVLFHRRLAADWAALLGHQTPERLDWLSQLK